MTDRETTVPDAQALGPLKGLIQKAEQGFPERSATRFNLPGPMPWLKPVPRALTAASLAAKRPAM